MALSAFLARSAKGYALINRAAVANLGGFADNDAHSVVNKHAAADFCRRMNLNAGAVPHNLRNCPGKKTVTVVPKPVCRSVPHNGVKTGVNKQNLKRRGRCGVTLFNGVYILFKPFKHSTQPPE